MGQVAASLKVKTLNDSPYVLYPYYCLADMSNALISVIVPVYNSECTLHRCVDSILGQTYHNIELLLVNDGSKDRSAEICDEYAKKDSRVRVFHKANGGVSCAREFGLVRAKGLYVIHVDSDDMVDSDMLEDLYSKAKSDDADMVICDFIDEWDDKKVINHQSPSSLDSSILVREMFTKLHGSCCNKLVKRELFVRYNIHFPEDLNVGEDLFVNVLLLLNGISVTYVPKAYYHYIHTSNPSSIINTDRDWSQVYQKLIESFSEPLGDKYPDILDYLRLLAKRECFINGMSYEKFVQTCPEINSRIKDVLKLYGLEKSLKFACYNRVTYNFARRIRNCYRRIVK